MLTTVKVQQQHATCIRECHCIQATAGSIYIQMPHIGHVAMLKRLQPVVVFSVLRHDFWIKRDLLVQKYVMLRANLTFRGKGVKCTCKYVYMDS